MNNSPTDAPIIFRPARPEDFPLVRPLLQQLWAGTSLDAAALQDTFTAALSAPRHFAFCAEREGNIVGFATLFVRASLWQRHRLAYVGELVVDAANRGQGIGTVFIQHLAAFAAAQGCSRLELETAPHRAEAHRFYERCGFERRSLLFSLPLVTIDSEEPAGEIARQLIESLGAELRERYGTAPSPFSAADAPAPRSIFLVARLGNQPVGCGALRRIDNDAAELKRMYVAPAGRRRGIARRIVTELEQRARDFGYRAIRLETGLKQPDAIGLYESCGFQRIENFGPYVGNPVSVCFEKMLSRCDRTQNSDLRVPNSNSIQYREGTDLPLESVLTLYRVNEWSSAEKPELLHKALLGSHSLVTAWDGARLIGLGNAISDGWLVVYYPHLLVLPEYQRRGIGSEIMRRLQARYEGFHQHMLVADGRALDFYRMCGFVRAGQTEPMWIYAGHDH